MAESSYQQWQISGTSGFHDLKLVQKSTPKPGSHEVLVAWKWGSLNYRDLVLANGQYPIPPKKNAVPGSDAAGIVTEVGPKVLRLKKGDQVCAIFTQAHQAGPLKSRYLPTTLGGPSDGVLQQYSVLSEDGLVPIPRNLDLQQASTLPCAGVTAWNALYGVEGRRLCAGQWVLTQGTGGVSMFALQFAKAAGARVVATTSSAAKAEQLKKLGADHVINYKETANWGEEAAKISGGEGVDFVVEIGGSQTVKQSLAAIKPEGVITLIGFVSGQSDEEPTFRDILTSRAMVRGIVVGSRLQFEEMTASIEANDIKPIVDEKTFDFKQLPDAYQYMWEQKHFGKLTVKLAS